MNLLETCPRWHVVSHFLPSIMVFGLTWRSLPSISGYFLKRNFSAVDKTNRNRHLIGGRAIALKITMVTTLGITLQASMVSDIKFVSEDTLRLLISLNCILPLLTTVTFPWQLNNHFLPDEIFPLWHGNIYKNLSNTFARVYKIHLDWITELEIAGLDTKEKMLWASKKKNWNIESIKFFARPSNFSPCFQLLP